MVKIFLKIFILILFLESTLAVAAQYYPHELGLKVIHLGHHSFKQVSNDKSQTVVTSTGADH